MRIFTTAARGACLLHTLLPALLAGVLSAPAIAQDGPIRFVVPYPPGGAPDQIARLGAQEMGKASGAPIIVENKPGKLTMGSAGTGNITYLAGEHAVSKLGFRVTHVPYQRSAPAIVGLMGSSTDMSNLPYISGTDGMQATALVA
ncbi:tripartite tricarboxylate transporter substrate-binding protein [Achromobacter marplatensis]|uniref:tripartite tricarboxylate transporter substrate-binding protein n=1 Tax=Achromobacter marplatensis TaxID=470868 RepID=UPI0039F72F94